MGEPNMSAFLDIESGFIRIRFKVLQMFTNPHNNKKLFLEISHNVSYCADSKNINISKFTQNKSNICYNPSLGCNYLTVHFSHFLTNKRQFLESALIYEFLLMLIYPNEYVKNIPSRM